LPPLPSQTTILPPAPSSNCSPAYSREKFCRAYFQQF
jgi:hypothetical protein